MAHNLLTVEIEHTRYKTLLDDRNRADGSVRLTTIQPHQHRAVISVYHERQGKRSLITDFEFIPTRGNSQEFPDLRLEATWTAKNRAHLKLVSNGRLYAERDVRLPGRPLWPVAIPIILVALIGGLLLMWPHSSSEADTRDQTAVLESASPAAGAQPDTPVQPETAPPHTAAQPAPPTRSTPAPAAETPPPTSSTPPRPSTPPPAEIAEAAEPREYQLVVYFRPDSSEITADARQELRDFAAQLPDIAATRSRISGHTAIAGPAAGRLPLSRRRAEAVSAELLTAGVQFGSDVQIRGFGGRQPVTRNPELQDNNRRVEVNLRYPPSNRR